MNGKVTQKKVPSWQARWFHFALWLAIITIFVLFLRAVQPILLPFVLGMLVAYLMDPFTSWLERRVRINRTAATSLVTFAFFFLIALLVAWLIPALGEQFERLTMHAPAILQEVASNAKTYLGPWLERLNSITGQGPEAIPADTTEIAQRGVAALGKVAHGLFSSGAAFVNVMALLMLTPIVCFYLIRDWPSVMKKMDAMLPLAYAPIIREQLNLINRTLAGYLRGQVTVMIILSVYYIIAFLVFGLNFGLVLGLLAGCLVIIPYLGFLIAFALGIVVAYGQFQLTGSFWLILGVYGLGQVIESNFLTPTIVGDRVGLHPLWLLFGMLAGGVLLGFVGVLLAVPLTAVIGVLVKFAVSRYMQSSLYLSQ
jgi:predicted PurR-regulated permease PerM